MTLIRPHFLAGSISRCYIGRTENFENLALCSLANFNIELNIALSQSAVTRVDWSGLGRN